jgi:hypothetical protein
MTMHAAADIIWLVGAVLVTLALDFLSRRFGGGRLRRHPGRPAPERNDPQSDVSTSFQQTRTRIYPANTPERGR